jgi:hypothetical protein
MKSLLTLSLFASLGMAIWPIPIEYSHGETVLWINPDVTFYWGVNVSVDSVSLESITDYTSSQSDAHMGVS